MSDTEHKEQEDFEIPAETVKAIASSVADEVTPAIKESLKEDAEQIVADAIGDKVKEASKSVLDEFLAKTEEIEQKNLDKVKNADLSGRVAKGLDSGDFSEKISKMSPAMRFYLQTRALDPESGDSELLTELNKFALATQLDARDKVMREEGQAAVAKTGYANETTAADGSVLIPDAEFVTTVFDNLPSYGVAFQFADVRQTDRTSVRVLSLDSGLSFNSTAEAGVKTGAKLAFAKNEVSLAKYAVIVPSTDELSEDSAVDYWNLVTRELTRGYAKKVDEAVFVDEVTGGSGSGQKGGLTNITGVTTKAIAGSTPTWDDLLALEAKLEDDIDTSNYKWFLRKEDWYRLVQTRADSVSAADGKGPYLGGSLSFGFQPNINNPVTPWGTPVVFTRVLATSTSDGTNDAFGVFGDLSNTIVYNKNGMALKMLTEATVVDSEGSNLNLATQDASAMRAVIRFLHICPKGNRPKFGVLGKGTVS